MDKYKRCFCHNCHEQWGGKLEIEECIYCGSKDFEVLYRGDCLTCTGKRENQNKLSLVQYFKNLYKKV